MKRREFIQLLSGGIVLFSSLPLEMNARSRRKPLRFGIVTDSHYADRDVRNDRYYRHSLDKMRDAMDVFNRSDLDFIIELGDMKDMNPDMTSHDTLRFVDEIEAVFQQFRGRTYHVLGNHDMDSISKQEFLDHTENSGTARGHSYYSFTTKGIRFIVLDTCFNADGSPFDHGNYSWEDAHVSQEELEWLRTELQRDKKPVIVFTHILLDYFSDVRDNLCVRNADKVVSLLEESGHVLAVFQGHWHAGHYSHRNGIHYWTMKAMIKNEYPAHNSYAIAEVDAHGNITIQGFSDCESRDLPHVE